jgi:Ca-activated chloride channel family protein
MDWLNQFHFLRPLWLLAVLPALLLTFALWRNRGGDAGWRRAIAPQLLQHLLEPSISPRSRRRWLLLLAGWLVAAVALAGPSWERLPQPLLQRSDALVIVLDLSLSMLADDIKPSRLQRARYKVQDILERRREGFTGLVAFAGSAHVVAPLTDDGATIANLIPALSPEMMPLRGSDPTAGVAQAIQLLQSAGQPYGRILLIGDDLRPGDVDGIAAQLDSRWQLSLLGVGTEQGAPLPVDGSFVKNRSGDILVVKLPRAQFQELAQRTDGRFSELRADDGDLDALLPDTLPDADTLRASDGREGLFDQWRDRGAQLALLLLPLAALAFRRGWLLTLLPLALLPLSPRADALEWRDLWQRPDQRAAAALEQGDADTAADTFRDPAWRASALYRAGDYPAAAQAFAQRQDADAHYNRGNALAHAGKLEEALAAYDAALRQAPDMEDAKTNRELVESLLQQQAGDPSGQDRPQQDSAEEPHQQQPSAGGTGENTEQPPSDAEQERGTDTTEQRSTQSEDGEGEQQGDTAPSDESDQAEPAPAERHDDDESDGDGDDRQAAASAEEQAEAERERQRTEQWLRQIPDDPSGLLRRKFQYEQRLRERAGETRDPDQPLW